MTLLEYFRFKQAAGRAITAAEMSVIGMKWPPAHGWLKRYGSTVISDEQLTAMYKFANDREERREKRAEYRFNQTPESKAEKALRKERRAAKRAERKGRTSKFRAAMASAVTVSVINPLKPVSNWIGNGFYNSREWRTLRYKALMLHGAQCQCCGATRVDGAVLHVDHIKPRSLYPELQLSLGNLQILCQDCNLGKSNKDDTDWR